jgi:hypothetical protein
VRCGWSKAGKRIFRCRACNRKHTEPPPPPPPGAPVPTCHRCNGKDLAKAGKRHGRRYFTCRACARGTYGVPVPTRPDLPCPYCGEQCHKHGKNTDGSTRYLCKTCKRRNTGLFPSPTRPKDGPYPHSRSFCLDIAATNALIAYCNHHGCSQAQAVRAIFREAARPRVLVAAAPRKRLADDGFTSRIPDRLPPPPETPEPLHLRLPNLRAEALRKRMARPAEIRHLPSVYVCHRYTVCLDDLAYTGLLRTMRRRGLGHQDAARALLAEAHPDRQPIFASGRLGTARRCL